MSINSLVSAEDGLPLSQIGDARGAALVTLEIVKGTSDMRFFTFSTTAGMPADITSAANVLGDFVKSNTFDGNATNLEMVFHVLPVGYTLVTDLRPVCMGVLFCVNAADDNDAKARLTQATVTGNADLTVISNAGKLNTFMASFGAPVRLTFSNPIVRVDAIGVPCAPATPPTTPLPAYATLRVY